MSHDVAELYRNVVRILPAGGTSEYITVNEFLDIPPGTYRLIDRKGSLTQFEYIRITGCEVVVIGTRMPVAQLIDIMRGLKYEYGNGRGPTNGLLRLFPRGCFFVEVAKETYLRAHNQVTFDTPYAPGQIAIIPRKYYIACDGINCTGIQAITKFDHVMHVLSSMYIESNLIKDIM